MEMIDVLKKLNEISERELTKGEEKSKEKFVTGMKKNKAGFEKRYGDDAEAVMYATATKMAKNEEETNEGGMKDVHIGAQEAVAEYLDDDGNLRMPKKDVVQDLVKRSKVAQFPNSYELETAAKMVADDFDDGGSRKHEIDEPYDIESKELNTNTMESTDKKDVKEAIQISTDSPEEASMMMQILKLAGVQQIDPKMIGAEPEAEPQAGPEMDQDDAAGSMDMARMRDIIKNPEDEQKEETFANEPEEKVQDIDSLVNKHSGGLNRQKKTYPRVSPADNPMTAEDKITEEELANSLRSQYESFKEAYQTEAKKAKPDFLDMDKDGDKKEPMKKAIKDKEAK